MSLPVPLRRARASPVAGTPAHEVRIIGGRWRRRKLPVPNLPGLRPTPDRVRETLFNWLGQDLTGWRCLDAFAGSGALGFECASRGAREVLMFELHPRQAKSLRASADALGASMVRVACADALAWMKRATGEAFDVILLDPPFGAGLAEQALRAAAACLAPHGWIYLEAEAAVDAAVLQRLGLAQHRHLRAGAIHAHLLMAAAAPPAVVASTV